MRLRLAGTRMPAIPTSLGEGLPRGWPKTLQGLLQQDLVAAGVLIPIVERSSHLSVLFTERSPDLKHHAGQISFPGGRMEPDDDDVRHTALRETQEEVGIVPAQVEVIGYLETMPTITGFVVTPVVGLIESEICLVLDPMEVVGVFEVPLDFLLDETNQRHSTREFQGVQIPILEFQYESYRIWGATASMLLALRKLII